MAQNFIFALFGKPVENICSCANCDNKNCVGKRQGNACESCSCEDCTEPKTCLLYNKSDKHSVCSGGKVPISAAQTAAVGDGYEKKFKSCCEGKTKLVAPGYVFELPKICGPECEVSGKNKSETGYVFEVSKSSDCRQKEHEGHKWPKGYESKFKSCCESKTKVPKPSDCRQNEHEGHKCPKMIKKESSKHSCKLTNKHSVGSTDRHSATHTAAISDGYESKFKSCCEGKTKVPKPSDCRQNEHEGHKCPKRIKKESSKHSCKLTNKHSVGSTDRHSATHTAAISDGYEKKFKSCCEGKTKLVAPGYVFELPKICGPECEVSGKNKSEIGYVFEVLKSSDCRQNEHEGHKCRSTDRHSATHTAAISDGYESKFKSCCEGKTQVPKPSDCRQNEHEGHKCQKRIKKESSKHSYKLTNKHSVGSTDRHSATHTAAIGDGYKSKFKSCCEGKTKLVAPGYVFELPKICSPECEVSGKNKSETGYVFEVSKSSDCGQNECEGHKYTKSNKKESPKNSEKEKYNSPACCLEPSKKISNQSYEKELPGIGHKLKECTQKLQPEKQCRKCTSNKPEKIKSDSFVCMTALLKTPSEGYECDKSNKRYELTKCTKREKDNDLAKYVMDLRKKYSDRSHSECHKCSQKPQSRKTSHESCHDLKIYKSESFGCMSGSRKSSNDCSCHESAKYKSHGYALKPPKHQAQKTKNESCCDLTKLTSKLSGYVLELPINKPNHNKCNKCKKRNTHRRESPKSTTTCSSKCCPKQEKQYCRHANPPTNKELMKSTSKSSQSSKKSKDSCCCKTKDSCPHHKTHTRESPKSLQSQKTSNGSCHCLAKHKSKSPGYVMDLPKCPHQKTHRRESSKSTTTCSLECCPKQEKQYSRHANPPTNKELMKSTSKSSQSSKKSNDSCCCKTKDSCPHHKTHTRESPKSLQSQKTSNGTCHCLAKHKSKSPGYLMDLPKCPHQKTHRRESSKSTTTCSLECCPKQEKQYCRHANPPTNKELMKSTSKSSQSSKKSKDSCCCKTKDSCPHHKTHTRESPKSLQSQKTSNGSCHCLAKHKSKSPGYLMDLPKCPHQKTHRRESSKSTTTCSLECCPKQEKQYSRHANPPTNKELMKSTSKSSQSSKKSKDSCCYETKDSCLTRSEKKKGSQISSPEQIYAVMTDTLKKQESVVETQKAAYLPKSAKTCSGKCNSSSAAAAYATMTAKQKQQNSIVDVLKSAYLPQSSPTWNQKCASKSKQNHHDTLKSDYVTICTKCGPKKKIITKKCACKHNHTKDKHKIKDKNENLQIYWSTNGASHNAYYRPLRNKQGSLDNLHDVAGCLFELQNVLSKKGKKLDKEKQGSKKNQIEIQYFPFSRPISSEKTMVATPSNALCISLSSTDQENNKIECNTVSDVSKISSSSKTEQELEKNTQLMNKNELEIKRFTSETMHMFYNRNSSECNEEVKNKYESSKYSAQLPHQYTPTKNAQELFKNVLRKQGDEIELLINKYKKKSSECNTFIKDIESESSRYLNELPQPSLLSVTQSECHRSTENNSKSSGCMSIMLQTYKKSAHESARNTRQFSINRLEKSIPSLYCKDSAKQRSMPSGYECSSCKSEKQKKLENKNGYVYELPKYINNSTTQKSSCKYHESPKNSSESFGYVLELPKHDKHQEKKYNCSELANYISDKPEHENKINSELPGYVFELPTYTQKRLSKCQHKAANNAEVLSILKLVSKSIQSDTQNICKNKVGTQTDIIENLRNPASENTIDLCKDILKTQIHTIEVLKKIYFPPTNNTNSIHTLESSKNTCSSLPTSTELSDNTQKSKNKTLKPETAKLSLEVLAHEPYTELSDSLACKQSNISMKPKKISKYDIVKKLKEAYKACSCKICECVANKAVKSDVCKCKPCECDECMNSFLLYDTNDRQVCDCKPCDCIQCTKLLAEQCHNDSSQSGGCKTKSINRQTFVVAPVGIDDNASRVACTCSPCACIECGLVYPLGSSLINEMSTSTNRHALCRCEICLNENCDRSGFDSCRSQMRRKIMSKPVEYDTHDFDIRTAMIVPNKPMFQRVGRHDPIAMFAAVPNSYPTLQNRPSNTQTCSCEECECILCVNQKDTINAIKSFHLLSNKARTKSDFNDRAENCEFKLPCEYQLNKKIPSHDCVYDTCSSLNCEARSLKYSCSKPKNSHRLERHRYSDETYEHRYIKETPGKVLHPLKKGDVLTPSTHKLKVQNQMLQNQHLETHSILNTTTITDSSSKQNVDIFHELTTGLNASNKIGSITQANIYMNDFKTRYIDKRKTLKYDAFMYCKGINKRRSLYKNITLENEMSGNCFSDHSLSYCEDYSSSIQITRSNNKSKESSSNSSGHKYPEYLIQYNRKGTIERGLKDLMKLDMDETRKLNKCNIMPNSVEKHNVDKISYESMSGDEDSFMINNSENALIGTFRRNYKFGLRNNLRVQLSNENYKHNNCENTGTQNKERDQLQGSACLKGSQYSVKTNNENREYVKAINDFNEFHVAHKVFDYNISARHSLTIHDGHSDIITSTEILNANDYKRVRNTLNEAREFSLELIRLLKTYEKANNEFESISEKLKLPHKVSI